MPKRIHFGLLNNLEKNILLYFASKSPEWLTSDMLTTLAFISSIFISFFYYMSNFNRHNLIIVNLFIILHWYGDSMDGTLARYRNKERPNYGLFIDQICDMFSIAFIVLGMGSYILKPILAAMMLCSFYLLVIVFTFIFKFKDYHIVSIDVFSGTEARILLIIINMIVYFNDQEFIIRCIESISVCLIFLNITVTLMSSYYLSKYLKTLDERLRRRQI